ncbi:MAG: hypothetical protein CHKLHMKO_00473 [Candidatus Argoarchaeum ethanivorans]|uniref:Peptidase M1 membrane alanine aminopeptidase domain-containing protein n=1 Tax=Candidatus Argoarchaeum ethanivorans TaxID=2608793 RepID=A0A811T7X5_9EURY|nr:MAG: hypothetical protein CHKLHMKO_00473 [Candidatus Argoarchaeum ethanivorans]
MGSNTQNILICAGSNCNQRLTGRYYYYKVGKIEKAYCSECISSPRCDVCGFPTGKKYWKLSDSRILCRSCDATSIVDYEVAFDLFRTTKRYLKDYLNMDFKHPVGFRLLDKNELAKHGHNLLGYFEWIEKRGKKKYAIYILSRLPKPIMIGVFAHELTHLWQAENIRVKQSKLLSEGFAQWVEYRLFDNFHQETQMYLMEHRKDTYGQGLQVVKEIEKKAGTTNVFNVIRNIS